MRGVFVLEINRQGCSLPSVFCFSSNSVWWDASTVDEFAGLREMINLVTGPSKKNLQLNKCLFFYLCIQWNNWKFENNSGRKEFWCFLTTAIFIKIPYFNLK